LKTCSKCGKEAPRDAGFCPFCGAKLDEEKRAASGKSGSKRKINPKVGKRGGRQAKSNVLVDGSNVIWYGGKARLKNLQLLMRKLDENGYRYSVFVDASIKYDLNESERRALERMISNGTVHQTPARTSADEWILEYATNHPECRILTNDTFQDWESKYPVVDERDRFISFMIVDGEVMLPRREAGPLPEQVDAEIYCGDTYTSLESYEEYRDGSSLKGEVYLECAREPPPEPAHALLERIKKMPRLGVNIDSVESLFIKQGARSVALIGYGALDIHKAKFAAKMVTRDFLGDEVFIEKTVPIWGEGKTRPIPGVAVILKRRRVKRSGKPTTEAEVFAEDIKELCKISLWLDYSYRERLGKEYWGEDWNIYRIYKEFEKGGGGIGCVIEGTNYHIWAEINLKKGILGRKYRPKVSISAGEMGVEGEFEKVGPKFKRFFDAWRWVKEYMLALAKERELRGMA